MAGRTTVRWVLLSILLAAFAASVVTMFAVQGRFDGPWFYASLVLLGVMWLVVWLATLGAGHAARHADASSRMERAVPAAAPRLPADLAGPEPEMVVQKASAPPLQASPPLAVAAPAYKFRGFTLYERPGKGGPSRFFSKASPPGATPIELPPGYEAKWEAKKARPLLVSVAATEPSPLARDDLEVAPEPVTQKNCAAMTAPGEFCNNLAKGESKYCGKHANYKGVEEFLEIRKDQGKSRGAARFSSPTFEVRVARATPVAPKKASKKRLGPSTVVVQTDKPHTSAAKVRPRESSLDVRLAKPAAKPLKLKGADAPLVKRDQGEAAKAKRKQLSASELVVRLQVGHDKPLHVAAPRIELKTQAKKAKPLRVEEPEIVVVRDTRRRTNLGLPSASRTRKG